MADSGLVAVMGRVSGLLSSGQMRFNKDSQPLACHSFGSVDTQRLSGNRMSLGVERVQTAERIERNR